MLAIRPSDGSSHSRGERGKMEGGYGNGMGGLQGKRLRTERNMTLRTKVWARGVMAGVMNLCPSGELKSYAE